MNREQEDKLLDLYKKGLSSTSEDEALVNHLGDSRSGSGLWFNYIKSHRKKAPEDLENLVWTSIQSGEPGKRKRSVKRLVAITAAAMLVTAILLIKPMKQKEMSYEEKAVLLEEAITLVSGTGQELIDREILYEDELIIIYKE